MQRSSRLVPWRAAVMTKTRSPAIAEGPRDAGMPVEILAAVERLYYAEQIQIACLCQPHGLRQSPFTSSRLK